ncbi:MAG: response regulator [Candidatus Limivivens sp.]|nr:response regulator [Candidatus Limivivens sp.]
MYKVVLVDDEEWGLAGLESSFQWEEHGFEVVCSTTDPFFAWDEIRRLNPDVVFCDIKMPGIDGFAMLDRILQSSLKCKFIIVSGYAEFQYAQEAISKGVYDYLLKPVDSSKMDDFLEKLREVLDQNRFNSNSELLGDTSRLLEKIRLSGQFSPNTVMNMAAVRIGELSQKKRIQRMLEQKEQNMLVFWEEPREFFLAAEHQNSRKKELMEFGKALAEEGCFVGISRPFLLGESIENAIQEARCASAGWFIGKKPELEIFRPSSQFYFRMYSGKIRMAVSGKRIDQTRELLGEIHENIQKGRLRLDTVEFLVEDISSTLIRKYNISFPQRKEMESIGKILRSFSDSRQLFDTMEKNIVGQLLGTEKKAAVGGNEHFQKLLNYVDVHYGEQLQLKSLSEMFYMNMSYCSELFKKVTGKTFSEYLMATRMEAAMEMLQYGTETVSEVAEKTGFSDSYYFCKVFKKYFGISPNAV